MKRIIYILLAVFVLSMVPVTYANAQYEIENPIKRKERLEREAAAKKKRQQEAAVRRQREEETRKKREAEEVAQRQREAEEQRQREEAERKQAEREVELKKREAEEAARREREAERIRLFQELEANMVYVEGGTFTMGATKEQGTNGENEEKPLHQVTLSSFHICKFEVTQELWLAVMGRNPSRFKGTKLPVERVSWHDCQEFITELNRLTGKNYRLPTEAEWEYAARGGNRSQKYKYVGSKSISEVAWYKDNSGSTTHDVGTKRSNELGLYDMSGNVLEWCQDMKGDYSPEHQTNPCNLLSKNGSRISRGGSWRSPDWNCRVSSRTGIHAGRYDDCGLRLVY